MGFECLARKQALPMQLSQDGLEECVFVFVLQGNLISSLEPYLRGNSVARAILAHSKAGRLAEFVKG